MLCHHHTVSLRPESPDDQAFLCDLYLTTRDDEPGFQDLEPGERTRLLTEQFEFQRRHYRKTYPHAWYTVVMVGDQRAGRLYVARQPDSLLVIDLSLLPEYRGHGIGSGLLKNVQAESVRTGLPIRLSVVLRSAAIGFYQRLGFRELARDDLRMRMEWSPPRL